MISEMVIGVMVVVGVVVVVVMKKAVVVMVVLVVAITAYISNGDISITSGTLRHSLFTILPLSENICIRNNSHSITNKEQYQYFY